MNAKPYPKYKPSGVEWLGDVPEHWEVKRSDDLVSTSKSQIAPEDFKDQEVFLYSIPVIQETGAGAVENGDDIKSAKQVISSKSLLISKLNPRKATVCVAEPQEQLTLASTELVALTAEKCEFNFLEYVALSEPFRQGLDSKVQSVTRSHQRANPQDIYRFWFAWPSSAEQQAIADLLDERTAKLDGLLGKKRALIGKLKEKRSALISRTVTQGLPAEAAAQAGLPPNPKIKPSGIPWLGDIPEHWDISKAGHFISVTSGFAFPSDGFSHDENDTKLLRGANIGVSRIRWDDTVYWPRRDDDQLGRYELKAGDLVLGMDRPWISGGMRVAKISESDLPCLLLQRVVAIATSTRLSKEYFYRLLSCQVFIDYFTPEVTGVSVPHISPEQISSFMITLPPLNEQLLINDLLERHTAKIDRMIQKVETAIEKLTEYRTALITAAVTGKIDVQKST